MALRIRAIDAATHELINIEVPRIPGEQGLDLRERVRDAFQRVILRLTFRGHQIQNGEIVADIIDNPQSPAFAVLGEPAVEPIV